MSVIKNRSKVIEELTNILMSLDKEFSDSVSADVYAYYDNSTGMVELSQYERVGHSWKNDDHITIYTKEAICFDVFDMFDDVSEMIEAAACYDGQFAAKIMSDIMMHYSVEEFEELDRSEIINYIKKHEDLYDNVKNVYSDHIDERQPEYKAKSEEIIDSLESFIQKEQQKLLIAKPTHGVDTIEVKAVETDCSGFYQDIRFSVIAENNEELLGFSWMEEVTEEEYPAEPFEESYWVLAEMGFTKEI